MCTKVQGKSAFNLKSSALKQLLKSSKDGLSLTIQRPADLSYTCTPTLAMPHPHPSGSQSGVHANPRASHLQAVVATSNPENVPILLHPGARCNGEPMQSPSTPKSNLSENSVGYHSLSHSVPSDISNGITNLGMWCVHACMCACVCVGLMKIVGYMVFVGGGTCPR